MSASTSGSGPTMGARLAGDRVTVAFPYSGAVPSRDAVPRRDVSPTIVYTLIMATTLVSFWDLFLLGTHVHG